MSYFKCLARTGSRVSSLRVSQCYRPQQFAFRPSILTSIPRKSAPRTFAALFHSSGQQREVVEELAVKLDSEIALENDERDGSSYPSTIKDYLDNSPFKIHDVPGQVEVTLTRKYGDNEDIKVTCNISDLDISDDPDKYYDGEDPAMMDEQPDNTNKKPAAGRKPGRNPRSASQDEVPNNNSDEDALPDDEDSHPINFPVRVTVHISRPGKGCMVFDAAAEHGDLVIESVSYYDKPEFADPKTPEQEWPRRTIYTGPPFGNLDEDLQILYERYLEERGVNTSMALFIPDYLDYKEQREYITWLQNARKFVS